jgi:hypothetical protein
MKERKTHNDTPIQNKNNKTNQNKNNRKVITTNSNHNEPNQNKQKQIWISDPQFDINQMDSFDYFTVLPNNYVKCILNEYKVMINKDYFRLITQNIIVEGSKVYYKHHNNEKQYYGTHKKITDLIVKHIIQDEDNLSEEDKRFLIKYPLSKKQITQRIKRDYPKLSPKELRIKQKSEWDKYRRTEIYRLFDEVILQIRYYKKIEDINVLCEKMKYSFQINPNNPKSTFVYKKPKNIILSDTLYEINYVYDGVEEIYHKCKEEWEKSKQHYPKEEVRKVIEYNDKKYLYIYKGKTEDDPTFIEMITLLQYSDDRKRNIFSIKFPSNYGKDFLFEKTMSIMGVSSINNDEMDKTQRNQPSGIDPNEIRNSVCILINEPVTVKNTLKVNEYILINQKGKEKRKVRVNSILLMTPDSIKGLDNDINIQFQNRTLTIYTPLLYSDENLNKKTPTQVKDGVVINEMIKNLETQYPGIKRTLSKTYLRYMLVKKWYEIHTKIQQKLIQSEDPKIVFDEIKGRYDYCLSFFDKLNEKIIVSQKDTYTKTLEKMIDFFRNIGETFVNGFDFHQYKDKAKPKSETLKINI